MKLWQSGRLSQGGVEGQNIKSGDAHCRDPDWAFPCGYIFGDWFKEKQGKLRVVFVCLGD